MQFQAIEKIPCLANVICIQAGAVYDVAIVGHNGKDSGVYTEVFVGPPGHDPGTY